MLEGFLGTWYQGRVSKSLEWGCPWTQKEVWTIPVWFFHCMQFHFLLLHGSVRVKGPHRANNGKQRTRLPGDLPFIKTSSRIFPIFGIPDLPISHGLLPYKEHIKQPRLRRHGAKTPQKSVFTRFQINFYHSYSISFKMIVICWWMFFGV